MTMLLNVRVNAESASCGRLRRTAIDEFASTMGRDTGSTTCIVEHGS
jgi:hypothetical protein